MEKAFEIEIVTPEQAIFKGNIISVSIPGTNGRFQILYNHAPITSTIGTGKINMVLSDEKEKSYEVTGGVVEVMRNKVIVLVEKILAGEVQEAEEA